MPIEYQRELDFTVSVLRNLRLPVHLVQQKEDLTVLQQGLRELLGLNADDGSINQVARQWSRARCIYQIMDPFMCHYIYLHLPATPTPTAVVIGPYLTQDLSSQMILEQTERLGLPMHTIEIQSEYYASLPVFNDPRIIMTLIGSLGEVMWGSYDMVDVNYEQHISMPSSADADSPIEQKNILQQMQQMEERYAYEDQLMDIVSKGLITQAEVMMSGVSSLNYHQRLSDPLRNMKNYCIICNTLLRKAAQRGGVHPLNLDKISSHYARMIENAPAMQNCSTLIGEMIRAYCRLVHVHSHRNHSAIVQKCLAYIDANLSGDLTLSTLAKMMNIAPGYLSSRFHQETGTPLSNHINAQRMKAALQLLHNTRLQVQSVAQLCGYSDPNYFSRLFKQYYGVTPAACRKERRIPVQAKE